MPIPVTIPRLGWNMEEGTFVEWLKADGDTVKPGEVVFRLEGEKATVDDDRPAFPVGAPGAGFVAHARIRRPWGSKSGSGCSRAGRRRPLGPGSRSGWRWSASARG